MHEPPCLELYAAGLIRRYRARQVLGLQEAVIQISIPIWGLFKDLPERMGDKFAPRRHSQAGRHSVSVRHSNRAEAAPKLV